MLHKDDLMTLAETREQLGISKVMMARLIRDGRFTVYANLLNKREKLISGTEIDEFWRSRRARLQSRRDEETAAD